MMSKKCVKTNKGRQESRIQPAILRRKRKNCDLENEDIENEDHKKQDTGQNKQTTWLPLKPTDSCSVMEMTPTKSQVERVATCSFSQFRTISCFSTPKSGSYASPLPQCDWADSQEVWDTLLEKETNYVRCTSILKKHPGLQPRMRAILLDWLIEVCEVYQLHRETYYLAQDYLDRYLAIQTDVPKQQLQLLGVSALFIAAKVEEIYPPKLQEFAYVTDGACKEDEILDMELVILKALNWNLCPVTVCSWLSIYLQLAALSEINPDEMPDLLIPEFSGQIYCQICQIIDLASLDIGSLQFTSSIFAASALCHVTSSEIALSASGLKWIDIERCVRWLTPFAKVAQESNATFPSQFKNISSDDAHNIQTHCVSLQLYEKALAMHAKIYERCNSPRPDAPVLSPPRSGEKELPYRQNVTP